MALSDLAVFSEYTYSAMTETVSQQIELFNQASRGTVLLQGGAHQGDYSDSTFFQKISGLVKRRNAYGTGAVSSKKLVQLVDTMVKVAAGTPPVELNPSQWKWIQMNPEEAGAALGQQLAGDTLADMLNTAINAARPAMAQTTAILHDVTGLTDKTFNSVALNNAAWKFGDRSQDILAWIVHSAPLSAFYNNALTNAQNLFKYETVAVLADAFGRVFICTDAPGLVTAGAPNVYWSLGLTSGAIEVHQNNDFTDNYETKNGDENIQRTYQAEWSYELGIKGYTWDKTNGGKSPNDAALATATNWDKIITSDKDGPGVVLKTQ